VTRRSVFLAILFLVFGSVLVAEELSSQEVTEAPESLFEQKIGDIGVSVDAEGTWTTRLAGGWGQGFSNLGILPGLGYPGLEKGAVFSQQPDFSLTLRLLERYYLQVIYSGSIDDRSFLVGYQGQEGELVQWAKAGNASFAVPSRAGQALADGRRGAPAAAIAGTMGTVSLELLGRYEDGTRETKTFRGFRETHSSLVGLDQWIRNRFFRLPSDRAPFTGIRVMVSDPAGSYGTPGDRYRDASLTEALVNEKTGEIRLDKPATRRYLVTWTGAEAWSRPASPLLGLTATSTDDPTGKGATWFVLVQPGTPSPFEQRNRYPVPTETTGAILLIDRDKGTPISGYTIGQASTQDWFDVSGNTEAPFYAIARGLYPVSTSGAGAPPTSSSTLPWAFQLPSGGTATSFSLGSDILASSLIVLRNGVPTTAFRFEAESGTLALDIPVYDTDAVEISFQRTVAGSKASDLVLWQGGRWEAVPGHNLEWALQGRWNMEKGRYTTEDLQSPGRMAVSLAYEGAAGDWNWKLAASGGALLTDSTGHRRLYGMASAGTQATLDGNALRPSALPGSLGGTSLTEANRAALVFRDYWTTDPLTGTPDVSAWGKAGVTAAPSVTDGWIGPYLVRGDGIRTDRLAVMESDPVTGGWAGMQVYLDQGKPRDLKATSAVSLVVRVPEGADGARLFFQAGTLSENWDGTGAIREVEYRSYPALSFFDQNRGQRYFPLPEGSDWGNDAEGDGSAGGDGTLVVRELPSDRDYSGWQTIRFTLTDPERQVLERTTGWRLVLVRNTGSGPRTVLVGPVVFEGSTWSVKEDATAVIGSSVTPVEQVDPENSERQQLRIDWADRSQWTVEGRHSAIRPASYRALSFRYQLKDATTTDLDLRVTDADGRGVRAQWTAGATSGWVTGRIDLKEKTLTLDGLASGGIVTLQTGAVSWDRLTLTKGGASRSGELVLAEVEAIEPVWEPLGTSSVSATWKQPAAWPSAELPLVSGVSLETTSLQSGLTSEDLSWRGQTTLSGSLGPLRASGEATFFRTAQEQEGHGAYEATLPLGWSDGPRIEWTDRFSDVGLRSEKVVLGLPWVGTWEAQATAKGPPVSLDQEYSLGWTTAEGWPGWKTAISGRWAQSRPQSIPLTGFGRLWGESWTWLPPSENTAPFYYLQAVAKTQGTWQPFSWELKTQNQASQSIGTALKWNTWGDWGLKVPFRTSGDSPWTLTPSVTKSVSAVYSGLPELTPQESARRAIDWLWTPPGSLASLPFWEQNMELTPWRDTGTGFESGLVQSTAGLDWERPAISDWTDLVVPNAAGTKLTINRGQESTAGFRSGTMAAQIQAKALNVFGALGSLPVFPWYRTDVWTWSTKGTLGTGTRDQDRIAEAGISARSDLILTLEEGIALPVSYQGNWGATPSQTWKTHPVWTLRRPANLPFELPRWLSPSAFRRQWVQDLGVALDFGWQPKPSPLLRDLQVTWRGRLLLSEKSELSLTTKWGQQWQQNLTVVGLEAAVDLVLNF